MENRSAEREVFRVFRKAMRLGGFFGERAAGKRVKNPTRQLTKERKIAIMKP
jgi:hypothetical protein